MEYNKKLYDALAKVEEKHKDLNKQLEQEGLAVEKMTQINRQLKQSTKIVDKFVIYKKANSDIEDAEQMLNTEKDPEMLAMAKEIINTTKPQIPDLEQQLRI